MYGGTALRTMNKTSDEGRPESLHTREEQQNDTLRVYMERQKAQKMRLMERATFLKCSSLRDERIDYQMRYQTNERHGI